MGGVPGLGRGFGEKDADGVGELTVGGDVEDVFGGRGLGFPGQRGALADEIVLVRVALRAGVGLHAANGLVVGHGRYYAPGWSLVVGRWPVVFGRRWPVVFGRGRNGSSAARIISD